MSKDTNLGLSAACWPRALALCLAVAVCYANSLRVPFLLDDPRPGVPLDYSTRVLVWASFDLNRALSGSATWSFHVFNALVHLACGLLLFGVLRRAMAHAAPRLSERTRTDLAFVTSLLWLCHPLQTAAVTYLSQRAEALGAFFYLAVLYCFLRSASAERPRAWQALALLALALGLATKETSATAPLVVLLFDALFLADGPRSALRLRRGFYGSLALVTLALGLVFVAPPLMGKDETMGLGLLAFGPLEYARTQPGVVLHYLKLAFWPHPLCFDYGWPIAKNPAEYLPQAAVIAVLLGATLLLLLRRSWIGFAGACFFVLLAPTSSFVPIRDPAFEHRMYLPLAAVLVLAVSAGRWLVARFPRRDRWLSSLASAAALACVALTVRRNQDYRSTVRIWQETVALAPHHARAHDNLGVALLDADRPQEAVAELLEALRLDPEAGYVYLNLGVAFMRLEQVDRAIPFFERAVEVRDRRAADALGNALAVKGDHAGAAYWLEQALVATPDSASIHYRLAKSLEHLGRAEEAARHYQEARRIDPRLSEPPTARQGDAAGAAAGLEQALELHPDDVDLRLRFAQVLGRSGRVPEAIQQYEEVLHLAPERQDAHINLAALLVEQGRQQEALEHSQKALEILPNSAEEQFNVAQALRALGRLDEAMAGFLEASRMAPELAEPYAAYAKTVCMKPAATDDERREALRLAQKAVLLTNSARADLLEIAAQTQAALGEYRAAVKLVEQALALPGPSKNVVFASRLRQQREDYMSKAGE